jgi:hypothetical protein
MLENSGKISHHRDFESYPEEPTIISSSSMFSEVMGLLERKRKKHWKRLE